MTDRDGCIALNMISGIGYIRFTALSEYFGGAGNAACRSVEEYLRVNGINAAVAEKLASSDMQKMCDYEKILAERSGVRIITICDPDYPQVLKELYDPPVCLYVRGRLPAFPGRSIAVVGSRRMSRYGEMMTRAITNDAAAAGYVIVSGLAYGVDTIAHRTTVECGGTTVAVLGGGLQHVHPRENIPLAREIINSGGAVISEFPMDHPVSRTSFPRRNRIIAGLTCATLVVEAGVKSGALISAQVAVELGRDVFAVPGQATNEQAKGCHKLIREGAVLTESFDDIYNHLTGGVQMGLFPENCMLHDTAESTPYIPAPPEDLSPDLAEVYQYISGSGVSMEELAGYTGMDTAQLAALLMRLEFKFLIRRGADMLYYPAGGKA